jgi:hypothetical protein
VRVIAPATTNALWARIKAADDRYGGFSSAHEALGVVSEEWDELRAAVHANDAERIKSEALDLAAALIRLHDQLARGGPILMRSGLTA